MRTRKSIRHSFWAAGAIAKMRVFRVPEFLGVAVLLGLLGAILLFVSARVA
ncbi:hypothetical protein J4558_21170 [Leptolyngbya sp. 15MV]|nr:hypothetical protein J4558_21170 [Leptolyngbya sp. 15MV]